jgi:hypothetical protein
MFASSMAWTCCSTQPSSTRSSSRNPLCLLRYTSLRGTNTSRKEGAAEITQSRTLEWGWSLWSAPVDKAAAALVGREVDGGARVLTRRGDGGGEGGEEAVCGRGGEGGRGGGEDAAEVERAAEEGGRHGWLGWALDGRQQRRTWLTGVLAPRLAYVGPGWVGGLVRYEGGRGSLAAVRLGSSWAAAYNRSRRRREECAGSGQRVRLDTAGRKREKSTQSSRLC